jgi:hypothetical protein
MDAGDRTVWKEDQDLPPLSELGKRQAQRCERGTCGDQI